MLSEMFYKLWNNGLIQLGVWETIYMTLISSAIAYVIGLPLGVILSVTDANGIRPTPWVNRILGFVNPPVVGQHIMAAALGSQVDVEIYARRRQAMAEVLTDAGYSFQMPAGAFYFFPQAPGGDDVAFVNRLVEERVLAVPGSGFGCPGYFRLAFCVDETVIRNAAEGFARAYAAVAGK